MVLELAIAVVLLAGAGLITRSFYRLLHVAARILRPTILPRVEVAAPDKTYAKPEQQVQLLARSSPALEALPGVQSAATTTSAHQRQWKYHLDQNSGPSL